MSCDRVQSDLSRAMDGEALPAAAAAHLSACDDCRAFQETAVHVERRYRSRVLAGIDGLRRLEPARVPAHRPSGLRLPAMLAAALLLCCWAFRPADPPAPVALAAPRESAAPRARVLHDVFAAEEVSILHSPAAVLPVRLDLELLPGEAGSPEISLPRSLRF